MKIYIKGLCRLILVINFLFLNIGLAKNLEIGVKAPDFNLVSGGNKEISLDQQKDKIIILIYETRDVIEQNRQLKNELSVLFGKSDALTSKCIILPVINCSQANWFTKGVWQANLRKNSEKEHITIYGDWDGKMFSDYGMKDDESNVMIIDSDGVIRYFDSGKIEGDAIGNVKNLLEDLVKK